MGFDPQDLTYHEVPPGTESTITGTTIDGGRIEVRGCDLWTFGENDRLTRKDSFWKIRES